MTKMTDERLARLRMHRNNIARYQRLLKTHLTDLERSFIERRLGEEQASLDVLAAGSFAPNLQLPRRDPIAHHAA
jgi:hypothetical protein